MFPYAPGDVATSLCKNEQQVWSQVRWGLAPISSAAEGLCSLVRKPGATL